MKMVVIPVFQPILDLKSKQFCWLEALARINGDFTQRGHIQLLSLGEECGFIHHIDRAVAEWVLDSREVRRGCPFLSTCRWLRSSETRNRSSVFSVAIQEGLMT